MKTAVANVAARWNTRGKSTLTNITEMNFIESRLYCYSPNNILNNYVRT